MLQHEPLRVPLKYPGLVANPKDEKTAVLQVLRLNVKCLFLA